MMKHLSSKELLARTRELVSNERRITLELIEYLREIDSRRLFAELHYESLHEFCVRELGLSEGSAQRRIQAMRLTRDLPQVKEELLSGSLSLTNAAKAQTFFQREKKLGHEVNKPAVIRSLQGLTQKECELKLISLSPEAALPQERSRPLTPELSELKLVVSHKLLSEIALLKGLLAHRLPEASMAELLGYLVSEKLRQFEKQKGLTLRSGSQEKMDLLEQNLETENKPLQRECSEKPQQGIPNNSKPGDETIISQIGAGNANTNHASRATPEKLHTTPVRTEKLPSGIRVSLPRELQRQVWQKAQGQCEHQSELRRCISRYRLEIDHITPLAHGGSNELSNLRLLCRTHNCYEAEQAQLL